MTLLSDCSTALVSIGMYAIWLTLLEWCRLLENEIPPSVDAIVIADCPNIATVTTGSSGYNFLDEEGFGYVASP